MTAAEQSETTESIAYLCERGVEVDLPEERPVSSYGPLLQATCTREDKEVTCNSFYNRQHNTTYLVQARAHCCARQVGSHAVRRIPGRGPALLDTPAVPLAPGLRREVRVGG